MKSTIILPFYRNARFADLALRSILRHSCQRHELIVTVEPPEEEDRKWLEGVAAWWPERTVMLWHEVRKGFYPSINQAVQQAETDVVIVFTTDQVAGPNWDCELLKWVAPRRFVTGLLVESGASLIADGTIWKNFGYEPEGFREADFIEYCRARRARQPIDVPRHYLPMAFFRSDFIAAGMYPAVREGVGVSTFRGDLEFMKRAQSAGFALVEAQNALTYHFQHGSKRQGVLLRRHLNYIYPLGLKHVHRMATGYVSLYDSLVSLGAKDRIKAILAGDESASRSVPSST